MAIKNTQQEPKKNKAKLYLQSLYVAIFCIGIAILAAFVSFYFNGFEDQSQISEMIDKNVEAENSLGKVGALLGHVFIENGVGIAAFILPIFIMLFSAKKISGLSQIKPFYFLSKTLFFVIWLPIFLGFVYPDHPTFSGVMGFEINDFLNSFIGKIGVGIILGISLLIYLMVRYDLSWERFQAWQERRKEELRLQKEEENRILLEQEKIELAKREKEKAEELRKKLEEERIRIAKAEEELLNKFNDEVENQSKSKEITPTASSEIEPQLPEDAFDFEIIDRSQNEINITSAVEEDLTDEPVLNENDLDQELNASNDNSFVFEMPKDEDVVAEDDQDSLPPTPPTTDGPQLEVETVAEEETVEETAARLISEQGEYDSRKDLPNYQFPTLNLLKRYESGTNTIIDQKELEQNKNRILDTLKNYGIGIEHIKATIGPTVTLYEIVPQAGVRISKIKNLEDDIALSLAALGIRIIAPIPGKGTIGIEVPNSNPSMVSMHSVIASQKFQNADMELPIAFGKTITNETFIADLAKMPHLLMAGATGQGKSVGLNAIITSLIYKKHPSELKFVMVDPKKVELTLYSKIERHFLAKLPDAEEAIITDNAKVINTLNSLCIEMDDRYELLKNAFVRNIKEYNAKFKARKLNPENGHRYLPYIVLIVDEFADLIMTAGKEVELPIARLAQLARAVGIHLIIATQRPSVNVITGTIKANFPGRVAFRVTSKIDSRTILDSPGADQLIGKGDMLFTTGNELVRLQCAFVDTPEVDDITEFIGEQRGYPDAMHLPEYVGENEGSSVDVDLSDRDQLFEDAARLIVIAQQGSASLLQRKLKLGYNRAGRIIDQLEAAGIVGPFEGSKARQVLVADEVSLEQLLNNLN
ncbi:MAG TPA: DNA translocase FtsK [Faecalibacter sp.]